MRTTEELLKDAEMKYKTVAGDIIVRDGEYETRSGRKAVVLGFLTETFFDTIPPIVGYINIDEEEQMVIAWFKGGHHDFTSEDDLMRPWKDKPDKKDCRCESILAVAKTNVPNGYKYCVSCKDCGKEYPMGFRKDKPEAAIDKEDMCNNKDKHVRGELGDSEYTICKVCENGWVIVEEKKPGKQTLMEYCPLEKGDIMYSVIKTISEYLEHKEG